MSTRGHIFSLPLEVQLQIFSYFISWDQSIWQDYGHYEHLDEEGFQTLVNICLSCDRLRPAAEISLYSVFVKPRNICDRGQLPTANGESIIHEPCWALRQYLRTLIERPGLAGVVRTVQLHQWETRESLKSIIEWEADIDDEVILVRPSRTLAKSFSEAASKLLPQYEALEELIAALHEGDEDAEVALLLALVPNIRKLQLALPNVATDRYEFWFQKIFDAAVRDNAEATSQLNRFSSLKEVEIRDHEMKDTQIGMPISALSEVFCLPQLETLITYHSVCDDDPEDYGQWRCQPSWSSIRDLRLKNCWLSSAAISKLVESCKSLQKLEVFFTSGDNGEELLQFEWSELGEALKRHETTLEKLSIDIISDLNQVLPIVDTGSIEPLLPSLRNFENLKHLEIQQTGLTGLQNPIPARLGHVPAEYKPFQLSNILPSSLEYLGILNTSEEMEAHLEGFSKELAGYPHLKKIRVGSCVPFEIRHLDADEITEHEARTRLLKKMYGEAGVEWVDASRVEYIEDDEDEGVLDPRDAELEG